ncbi:hypothetical protein ACEPAH_9142 [Sanghuangporus vaninii]
MASVDTTVIILKERENIIATNYVGVASYVILIYDHLLTLSDEVNYIWRGGKGPVIYLFLLNRYFFPLAFAVNLYAYLSRTFNPAACKHFVRYEGATTVIAFGVTGLMMILRVNALYSGRSRIVQVILCSLWLAQVGVCAWLLSTGMPVPHSTSLHSCSLILDPRRMYLAALFTTALLVFDTTVVVLTLYKTLTVPWKSATAGKLRSCTSFGSNNALMKTILKNGLWYYAVVFSTNLTLMIMIVTASDGLKYILGQFSQLISVTMMSRITLHLRKIGARRNSTVIMSLNSSVPPPISSFNSTVAGGGTEYTTRNSDMTFANLQTPGTSGGGTLSIEQNSKSSSSRSLVRQIGVHETSESSSSELSNRYADRLSRLKDWKSYAE